MDDLGQSAHSYGSEGCSYCCATCDRLRLACARQLGDRVKAEVSHRVTRQLFQCGPGRGPAARIIPGRREPSERRAMLSVQLARTAHGSVLMVRRRSTVRFRNGAPGGLHVSWGPCSRLGLTFRYASWRGRGCCRVVCVSCLPAGVAWLLGGFGALLPLLLVLCPGEVRAGWRRLFAASGDRGFRAAWCRLRVWRGSCGGGGGFWAGARRRRGARCRPGGRSRRQGCAGCGRSAGR
jgi:hypothetical protein